MNCKRSTGQRQVSLCFAFIVSNSPHLWGTIHFQIIKCKTEAATFQKQMNAKVQALTLQMTEGLQVRSSANYLRIASGTQ